MAQHLIKSIGTTLRAQKKRVGAGQKAFIASRTHTTHQENQQKQVKQTDTEKEVQHHAQLATEWWNADGPMRALHALNEIRVPFIRDGLISRGLIDESVLNTTRVLHGQQILEVGCGGGILSEQLARLNANVTGIDLGEALVETARDHAASASPDLLQRLNYIVEPVDQHVKDNLERYDAVIVSEVLEHVTDKVALLTACVQALKPGGSIFITTLNKTVPMWIGGVVLGEYVLNLAPMGTHHWDKMISPVDVQRILDSLNCQTVLVNGSTYEFWRNTWRWINSTSMCYALQAVKTECN